MAPERVVLCGGASGRGLPRAAPTLALGIYGPGANVNLRLEEVRRAVWTAIPPVLRDLLDLACYVYAADQAVTRCNGGRVDGPEVGAGWRRDFRFRVPVRDPDRWNAAPVRDALVSALSFLSDEVYDFEFVRIKKDEPLDGHMDFNTTPFDGVVEEVVMFSGGLDSLAGAVKECVRDQRQVLLVNHRSNEKLTPRHGRLLRALDGHAGTRGPLHFPVRVNKRKALGHETTQRTRSFLFAALGTLFARMAELDRLRFYENGVVSLNLPPSAQVVGARASRTTHPRVLAGFGRFLTALLGRKFEVENPSLWETKTDVVRRIADAGCADLIGLSTSCGHTWERTRQQTHCGVCSQCIDRRFAVLAAEQAENDPADAYAVDLLTGERRDGEPKTMLAAYLDLADRVDRMGLEEFVNRFGELAHALPHVGLPAGAAAARVFDLYQRHARQVNGVISGAIAENAERVRRRELPRNCLLRLVYDDGPGEGAATPAEPARPAGNYFVRRGEYWAVRYGDGQERVYRPDIGFEYLRILLGCPGRHFTASELATRVRQCRAGSPRAVGAAEAADAGVAVAGPGAGDAALDPESLEAMALRLQEIEEYRPEVEASDSPTRLDDLDELDAQARAIRDRLGKDRRLGGRSRRLDDMRDRVRNRVCNAIRRALKEIDEFDKPLAAHLKKPVLNMGHSVTYYPRSDVNWTVD